MPYAGSIPTGLQQVVQSASCGEPSSFHGPHHPITCLGPLRLEDDHSLSCEHAKTDADDARVDAALTASVAILLIEIAYERFGSSPRI